MDIRDLNPLVSELWKESKKERKKERKKEKAETLRKKVRFQHVLNEACNGWLPLSIWMGTCNKRQTSCDLG